MKGIIIVTFALVTIITTLAFCKAAKKSDESLEHPSRITLKGDKQE